MPFLSIPLKKTAEVDIADPVRRWISSTYSSADRPEDPQAIQEFQKLRINALCRPLDKHESSLETLYRYYDQLVAVESKLPFGPTLIPVYFKWKDAFGRSSLFAKSSVTLASAGFEKACTLFNMAALQSQVAASQPLDNDNELKTAAKLFQQAAGILTYLKDSVLTMVGQETTADLMPDTLAALSALMLAQGQEAIYLKAARDNMKAPIIAKIAAQCADLYIDASKQMGRDMLRGLWEKDWLGTVSAKQNAFLGLAFYYQSLVSKEEKEIGAELAYLQRAQELFGSGAVAQLFPAENTNVQRAFQAAKKDNDFIYHERVPDIKSLPAIGRAALAKALPLPNGPMSQGFKDLFGHLVPVAIQQALAAYEARRNATQAQETTRMREATQLMNGVLASLNLPAAVEDACNQEALPASVREKANSVRANGGVEALNRSVNEMPGLLLRNQEILDETGRLLKEEQNSDQQLREQFKERWNRVPSEKLTEPLWAEIGKYRTILSTATNADQIVKQKFEEHRQGIELLSKSEAELRGAMPTLTGAVTGAVGLPAVQRLKQLLQEVEGIKAERQVIEEELKEPSKFDMTTTFLRALGESGALHEEQLSTDKLNEIFTPLRERITQSIQRQERILQDIQGANSEFVAAKGGAGVGGARQELLTRLANAHDAFQELQAHLAEGSKFYNDLTPLLVRMQQKVSDFCFARKTEKEELMRDLQQNIVSSSTQQPPQHPSTGAAKNQPPSRPPPPKVTSSMQQQAPDTAAYGNFQTSAAPPPSQQQPNYPPYQPYNPYVGQQPYPVQQPQQHQQGGYPPYPTWPGPSGFPPYPQPAMPSAYNPYPPYPQQYQQPPGSQPPYPTQHWGQH